MIDTNALSYEIRTQINSAGTHSERSQQRSIGASEVGGGCDRRLGYRLLGAEVVNEPDNWAATIGTAVHAHLATIYSTYNLQVRDRYLVEHKVEIHSELIPTSTVDLYDKEQAIVIDWKVVGNTALETARKSKQVSSQYQTQAHLYAYGLTRAGYDVKNVAIVMLPKASRNGLRDMAIWSEPYDENIAFAALARLANLREIVAVGGEAVINSLSSDHQHCFYCPYFLPASTNFLTGCPGGDSSPTTEKR